jgi:type III secretion system (T3SS) inner membrane Yop/YscD-like protein
MQARCPHCGASLHREGEDPAQSNPANCWMCNVPLPNAAQTTVRGSRRSIDSTTLVMRPLADRLRPGARRLEDPAAVQTTTLALPPDQVIRVSIVEGLHQGEMFDLSRPLVTIGRMGGGADIQVDDTEVSRLHCSIEVRADSIVLQDLRSTNGTFINDTRVFSARIEPSSRIRIGKTVLRIDRLPS